MADVVEVDSGTGIKVLVEAIGAAFIPISKIYTGSFEVEGGPVEATNPLYVGLSDGSTLIGTSVAPVRTDPTGTTAQPITSTQLPGALAAGGGFKIEGVPGGVAVPMSLASLPALAAGSAVIGAVNQGTGGASAWKVDGSAVTQPISDAGGSLTVDSPQLPAALAAGGGLKIEGVSGGVVVPVSDGGGSLTVDGAVTVSGTATVTQGTASAASAPWATQLSDGAAAYTGAKTGQLPTALAAGGGLKIEGVVGGVTVPVSGSVTVSGTATVTQGTGGASAWKVDGSAVTQPISATALTQIAAATVLEGGDISSARRVLIGASNNDDFGNITALISDGFGALSVNVQNTAAVQVISSALPTGAATDFQAAAFKTSFETRHPLVGQAVASASMPVVLASNQTVIPVSDNSGSLTVDSPQLPAALAAGGGIKIEGVSGGVVVPISDGGGSITVDGSVTVSGTATVTQGTAAAASAPWAVRISPSGAAFESASNPSFSQLSDGSATYTGAKTGQLPTALAANGGLKIEGVSGGVVVPVSDGGGSLTVDGAVTVSGTATVTQGTAAAASAPWATELSDGSAFYTAAKTGQLPTALAANGGLKIEGVAGGVVVPVSDGGGSLTVDSAQLPSALGQAANASSMSVVAGRPTTQTATTLATAGTLLVSGAGTVYWLQIANSTGGTVFPMLFDATTTRSNGTDPLYIGTSTSTGVFISNNVGAGGVGISFTNGLWLQLSSTQITMTSIASTACRYTAVTA